MDEEQFNIEIRKFLKKVGISSQREIERAVRKNAGLISETLLAEPAPPVQEAEEA